MFILGVPGGPTVPYEPVTMFPRLPVDRNKMKDLPPTGSY